MFDFAITGRPILFYAYDLAHYRDTLRGFYFDCLDHAPGPLLSTSGEVVAALTDLESIGLEYGEAYARFRERYCHLEDGRATARVLDRLFPSVRHP
jgi:CDP-glycerol glycerophosphotransferase